MISMLGLTIYCIKELFTIPNHTDEDTNTSPGSAQEGDKDPAKNDDGGLPPLKERKITMNKGKERRSSVRTSIDFTYE